MPWLSSWARSRERGARPHWTGARRGSRSRLARRQSAPTLSLNGLPLRSGTQAHRAGHWRDLRRSAPNPRRRRLLRTPPRQGTVGLVDPQGPLGNAPVARLGEAARLHSDARHRRRRASSARREAARPAILRVSAEIGPTRCRRRSRLRHLARGHRMDGLSPKRGLWPPLAGHRSRTSHHAH